MQPEKKLSGESSTSKTHDIVAMSSQGVKVITIEFSNLHSILKSGSELYRKYLARKARRDQKNAQAKFAKHNITSSSQTVFDKALENLNIVELLDANSAFRRLNAVQKRHLESLAEGPIHYNAGQRLWRMGAAVDKAFIIVAGTATFLAKRRNAGSVGFKLKEPKKSALTHSTVVAAQLIQEEEDRQVTAEGLKKSLSSRMANDAEKVLSELNRGDSDSSLSSCEHASVMSVNSGRSMETDTYGSVNDSDINSLVKGFKERADGIKDQQNQRRDSFESNDSTTNTTDADVEDKKKEEFIFLNTNKILGRLFSHRAYTSGIVFSRGHFLGDVSQMVAGLLSGGDEGDKDQSSDEASYCNLSSCEIDHIHHGEIEDQNIIHTSTLVAGKEGCVVLVFPKASLTPFLDAYPGLLLSLLGKQVIV